MEYCVATFHSVHEALHFEKVLKETGLKLQLIPVPREISSSCGIAARFSPESRPEFEAAIAKHRLDVDSIHVLKEKPRKKNLLSFLDK
ncbi:MAG: DUF3343 domain-containing protein [Clostridia bacterium]|jgi:hypothetical protein|nr:DUF3343 domain-containing protein [Clostridia bacterium]